MVWVNGCGCQRAYSYRHCAADAEMPVAFRSPRPSRRIVLSASVLTSRTAGYVTRTSGGVGGALSDGRPYPYTSAAANFTMMSKVMYRRAMRVSGVAMRILIRSGGLLNWVIAEAAGSNFVGRFFATRFVKTASMCLNFSDPTRLSTLTWEWAVP